MVVAKAKRERQSIILSVEKTMVVAKAKGERQSICRLRTWSSFLDLRRLDTFKKIKKFLKLSFW